MKRFPKELADVVEPALRAARDVLKDLDPDAVPAPLRRVVAHSGPRLTPPLAARLLAALDEHEWLRRDAAERLDGTGGEIREPDDQVASDPAAAFLVREDGWWAIVADAVATRRSAGVGARVGKLEANLRRREDAVAAAKDKLKQARKRARDETTQLRSELRAARSAVEAVDRTDAGARAEMERRIARLEEDLTLVRSEQAAAEATLVDTQRRLRSQRRDLAEARRALEAGGRGTLRDPIRVARELDLAAASAPRRHAEPADVDRQEVSPGRATLPPGVRPDRAEAVEWLLEQPEAVVIVDGYNVLFHLEPGEFTSGKARRALGDAMRRFTRKARGDVRVIIVFDSTLPGDRDTRWAGPGVFVMYAEADRLADEEVVRLAGETSGLVSVVSSDREVREDAAATGAVTLWSEAFVDWLT